MLLLWWPPCSGCLQLDLHILQVAALKWADFKPAPLKPAILKRAVTLRDGAH